MISLGIRKVVDTSGWDQSFVDGQGTSLTGGINLERFSSGDRALSGSTTGAVTTRPNWNRPREIEEQEQEAEVSAFDDNKAIPLEGLPMERSSRYVNPFLDGGLPRGVCQSKTLHLIECDKSGIASNRRTRGNERRHGEHEFSISVRDLDPRGRKTLPVCEMTAWLDSLRLFEKSRMRLNRSSSSPPPILCDQDLLVLRERTIRNGGESPFSEEPSALERQTSLGEDWLPAIDGRPSVLDDQPVLTGTPVLCEWTGAFEGQTSAFEGQTSAFEGQTSAFEGRAHDFQGRAPDFEGRAPIFEGRETDFEVCSSAAPQGRSSIPTGRYPFLDGLSPTSNGGVHSPIQRGAAAAGPASLAVEVPLAYSRAVSFLPAWDLERLEIVYRRLDTCGFYYGRMTMDEARLRLTGYPVGTFLLRDSSDRRFLFSLSIQTRRGTTSIRVLYEGGLFRLDSDPDQSHLMPTFDCALHLVRHYVRLNAGRRTVSPPTNSYVLRESTGRRDTPVLLRRPLEGNPASLAHSCRKSIHRSLGGQSMNVNRLHLKPSLKDYLTLYPYDI